ncbi:hypothetical protein BDN72DRAFT_903541 [Pluteus cervinus]|uniref:Uncharacterized protein n=1 Tax=Pluteus cervinus TaxID=181527 RepID=A0ACD3A8U4_9AGAR|nr:hypothetical protein BDN72DRAFT_903541 [Pluteus cervinus]
MELDLPNGESVWIEYHVDILRGSRSELWRELIGTTVKGIKGGQTRRIFSSKPSKPANLATTLRISYITSTALNQQCRPALLLGLMRRSFVLVSNTHLESLSSHVLSGASVTPAALMAAAAAQAPASAAPPPAAVQAPAVVPKKAAGKKRGAPASSDGGSDHAPESDSDKYPGQTEPAVVHKKKAPITVKRYKTSTESKTSDDAHNREMDEKELQAYYADVELARRLDRAYAKPASKTRRPATSRGFLTQTQPAVETTKAVRQPYPTSDEMGDSAAENPSGSDADDDMDVEPLTLDPPVVPKMPRSQVGSKKDNRKQQPHLNSEEEGDMDVDPAPVAPRIPRSQVGKEKRKAKQQPGSDADDDEAVVPVASGVRKSHVQRVSKDLVPHNHNGWRHGIDTPESPPLAPAISRTKKSHKEKREEQLTCSDDEGNDVDADRFAFVASQRPKPVVSKGKQKARSESPLPELHQSPSPELLPLPLTYRPMHILSKGRQMTRPESPLPALDLDVSTESLSPELLPPPVTYRPIPLPAIRPQPKPRLAKPKTVVDVVGPTTSPAHHHHEIAWRESAPSMSPTPPPVEEIMRSQRHHHPAGKTKQDAPQHRRTQKLEPEVEIDEKLREPPMVKQAPSHSDLIASSSGSGGPSGAALAQTEGESSDDERIPATTPERVELMTYPWYTTPEAGWRSVDGARLTIMPSDLRSMTRGSLEDWKCIKKRKNFSRHGQFVNLGKMDYTIFKLKSITEKSAYLVFEESRELVICVIVGMASSSSLSKPCLLPAQKPTTKAGKVPEDLVHKSILLAPVADQIDSALGNMQLILEDELKGYGTDIRGPSLDGAGLVFSTTSRKQSAIPPPAVLRKPKTVKKKVLSKYITNRSSSSSSEYSEYPNVKSCDAEVPIYEGRASRGPGFCFTAEDFENLASRQRYEHPELEDNALVAIGYSINVFGDRNYSAALSFNVQFVIRLF